jgi:hypothetical protein
MRSRSPHGLAESRSAMREIAAEWRAMHGGRRNPGGPGLGTLAVIGIGGYFAYQWAKKRQLLAPPTG